MLLVVTSQKPRRGIALVPSRADRVEVGVPVEPEDDVRVPVQQSQDLGTAEEWLAIWSGVPGPGMNEALDAMVREDHHEPIIMAGVHVIAGRVLVARVHLGEPCFQPARLVVIHAAGRPAGDAVRVQAMSRTAAVSWT